MTAVTLTAGDAFGGFPGYSRSGGSQGVAFGSISGQPLAGNTIDYLFTGVVSGLSLAGDQTALGSLTLTVDGVNWPVGTGAYNAGSNVTEYPITPFGGGFVNGNSYTVDLTAGGGVSFAGPTWINATPGAAGNITFASTGRAAGDKLYIAIVTANQAITTPTGFTEVPTVSPQSRGTAAAIGGIRLGLYEKVSDGTEDSVTITNPGNHVYAVGFVVRPASGQSIAIEASAGNTAAAATTHSAGGVTTAASDCLVINIYGTDRDSAGPSYSGQANASLTNVTERFDAGTTNGVGSGIMIATGEKTAAGSVSATTATSAASVAYAWITLALKNTTGGGGATVTPNNASHGHSATSPSLAAKSTLAPNSAAHSHTSTSPTLTAYAPVVSVSPNSVSHAHAATSPSLAAKSSVQPNDASHAHTSASPSVTAKSTVAPSDTAHAHTSSQPSLAAKGTTTPDSASHAHTATTPVITVGTIQIQPTNALHGHSETSPSIGYIPLVAPNSATHGHAASSPLVTTGGSVSVDGSTHAHSATSPTLASFQSVSVFSSTHGHSATQPSFAGRYAVVVNDNEHGHSATSPAIAFTLQVIVADVWHGHTVSEPVLAFVDVPRTRPTTPRPTGETTYTRPEQLSSARPIAMPTTRPGQSTTTRPRAISTGRRR